MNRIDEATAASLVKTYREGEWECRAFGAGKFSQTFACRHRTSGENCVLRVAPPDSMLQLFYEYRMMRQEPALHERLLRETTVPVPPILAYDFSRTRIDRDYLIMPMLPGVPLSQARLSRASYDRALRQWGGYIAQVHGLTDPENRFGYLGEHRCMEPQKTWSAAFQLMFELELKDIIRCGIYDEETARWAANLLRRHSYVFEACQTSRLLHGDIWVTNLLVSDDGTVTGVLDFDRACWGDIEWDLAIADYCGVTGPAFWEGYGRELKRQDKEASIRRTFYLVYEHQKYTVISMSERRNDPARARRYASESLAMLRQLERDLEGN
ncbi:MAG TPA: aminoglycoside phosphotransferase family protein [Acidobacteriota bacterium]|nr:aminoglycoside phosphotransferase family protein [Acidobacteriota bacterium]